MRFLELARSAPGRAIAATCGLGAVTLILYKLGFAAVGHALAGCAAYFPVVAACELAILACSTMALRALYGDAAKHVPLGQQARAALIGYAVQGIVPTGRAAAEAMRASLLARWVGAGRAGAAAARMQAVVLVVNGIVSIPTALAALSVLGPSWLPLAIGINGVVTLGLGGGLFIVARRARVGAWLGRRIKRVRSFGAEVDAVLEHEPVLPLRAIAWELGARTLQIVQHGLLVLCVAGGVGIVSALCAEGIHLVGAAIGDLIPAQLGAIEGNFTLSAKALGLTATGSVSIALVAHLAQLTWVVVGSLVPLFWPATSPGGGVNPPPSISGPAAGVNPPPSISGPVAGVNPTASVLGPTPTT